MIHQLRLDSPFYQITVICRGGYGRREGELYSGGGYKQLGKRGEPRQKGISMGMTV
jgi:hypothetical protein